MTLRLLETHRRLAAQAWQRRGRLRDVPLASAAGLYTLERQLCLHLHVLAGQESESLPEAGQGHRFVALAAALATPDTDVRRQALARLRAVCDDSEMALDDESIDALTLFPSAEVDAWLVERFQVSQRDREAVFTIWLRQGRGPEPGLFNRCESGAEGEALRHLCWAWTAWHDGHGSEVPARVCRELCDHPVCDTGAVAAVRGALIRRETVALEALQVLLSEATTSHMPSLLELAGLCGEAVFLPVLETALHNGQLEAAEWLGVSGLPEAAEILLGAMNEPRLAEAAARGWLLFAGMAPARRPRLQVVNESPEKSPAPHGETETLPDAESARRQWQRLAGTPLSRRLFGEAYGMTVLAQAAGAMAGRLGEWLWFLLAREQGRPLGAHPANWWQVRREVLTQLSEPVESQRGLAQHA